MEHTTMISGFTHNVDIDMVSKHYSYSSINTARSALSLLITLSDKDKTILKQFMKGAFNYNPPKPKKKCI